MEEKDSRAASIRHHLIMSSKTGPDGLNDQCSEAQGPTVKLSDLNLLSLNVSKIGTQSWR
ncbi:hypothetical protein EMIT0158MI4_20133 [Burkholderia ambifaria]